MVVPEKRLVLNFFLIFFRMILETLNWYRPKNAFGILLTTLEYFLLKLVGFSDIFIFSIFQISQNEKTHFRDVI